MSRGWMGLAERLPKGSEVRLSLPVDAKNPRWGLIFHGPRGGVITYYGAQPRDCIAQAIAWLDAGAPD